MKVYLAGPMRGIPDYNFPAFAEAAALLRARGYEVWSPHEHDAEVGGPEAAMANMRQTLTRDLTALYQQDALVLLDGWNRSHGACLERHAADVVSLPVFLFTPELPAGLVSLSPGYDWRWKRP